MRLEAAGYLAPAHRPYLDGRASERSSAPGSAASSPIAARSIATAKLAFLAALDVLSVPATYDEPKGMFLLEAMASGVPVVQPRRGAFTEIVEKTGGGLLVEPDDPAALADGLCTRCGGSGAGATSSAQQGFDGVRAALQHRSARPIGCSRSTSR